MSANCAECGRFMRVIKWHSNDHYDSEDWAYRCDQRHGTDGT